MEDYGECILSQQWRMVKKEVQLAPNEVRRVILHNLMWKYFPDLQNINLVGLEDYQGKYQPELWQQGTGNFWNLHADNQGTANTLGKKLHDFIANYLIFLEGTIPFHDRRIRDFVH